MGNNNCLQGLACPSCESEGPFKIVVTCWAKVADRGVEETLDLEWDDESACCCCQCDYTAMIKQFRITNKGGD